MGALYNIISERVRKISPIMQPLPCEYTMIRAAAWTVQSVIVRRSCVFHSDVKILLLNCKCRCWCSVNIFATPLKSK